MTGVPAVGHLELRDVELRYPGAAAPVLRGVSFRAEPGRTTAIIGSTGAGKTTLLTLVPRLLDVTGGAVLVDGVDVRDLDPQALWARLGLVPQRAFLFSGTVHTNLLMGKEDATDDELWHALEIAQAREFVEAMPEGLDAPIVQGGTNVSGGQRQRLAIARAFLADPRILVLDDATSAVDASTEQAIKDALREVMEGRTTLVIAHRLSTIALADEIVVLEDGRVVADGTHDALLDVSPLYREIVEKGLPDQVFLTRKPREREVALLAAGGLSSAEIATRLVVSVRTVDNHLQRAYGQLGIASRQELGDVLT